MQIPITRRGGTGGADLNFTVVGGTTQPNNPKENTIWIITDVEITKWTIDANEPTNPIEGMVWLVNNKREIKFNIILENTMEVYLHSVKQYINGVWTDLNARIYQNEEWHTLAVTVLSSTVDRTGGWVWYDSGSGPTATKNADGSYALKRPNSSAQGYLFKSINVFDLTNFSIAKFTVTALGNTSGDTRVGVSKQSTTVAANLTAYVGCTSTGTYEVDISGLTGYHSVGTNMEYTKGTITISNIELK